MKKLNVILLIFSFILSGIGGIFLFGATASNEGLVPTNAPIVEETTEYTFKTYEDYFVDYFNLPAETYTRDEATNAVIIDYTKITRTKANGETELSYNGEVFEIITNNDLSGSGSALDPYVVSSMKGFLYLLNYDLGKAVLMSSKYISLNCDIILNDEVFNEDGSATGGDGIVYNFDAFRNASALTIYGNNHYISGFYNVLTRNSEVTSIFGAWNALKEVRDLDFYNIFVKGNGTVSILAVGINFVTNCNVYSGFIHGGQASPFGSYTKVIKDCDNYAKITGTTYVSGIIHKLTSEEQNIEIINCNNYGEVFASGAYASGIISSARKGVNLKIMNCNNYASINTGTNNYVGGIIGSLMSDTLMQNCNNYGDCMPGNVYVGGIVGSVGECSLSIDNCQNSGEITLINSSKWGAGQLIGRVAGTRLLVKNSSIFAINQRYCFGEITTNAIVHLENIKGNFTNWTATNVYFCSLNVSSSQVFIKNFIVQITMPNITVVQLVRDVKNANIQATNIIINVENEKTVSFKEAKSNIDGLLFDANGKKEYYGTDFTGFYFSWRTGKIGLIAFDGRGQFQGQIDEEWLKNNGYQKKSV